MSAGGLRSRLRPMMAAVLAVAGVTVLPMVGAGAAEPLRLAYEDRALPPYYLGDGAGTDPAKPGLSVELVRLAAADLGLEVSITRMPWLRCMAALKQGDVDVIFNASFKEDRQESGVYPMVAGKPDAARRIAAVTYSLYRRKGTLLPWDGKSPTSLAGLPGPIGAPAGYSIIDDLTRAGVKVQEAPDTPANFKKLAAGRIDAVATLDVIGDELLRGYPGLEKVAPALTTKDYFVMVSHQYAGAHADLVEKLWHRIAVLRDSKGAELALKYAKQ